MLTKLSITNFKAFARGEFDLAPFTVLIGPNGSGKTTILQAVEFLGGLVRGTLQEHLEYRSWEYRDLPNLLAGNPRFSFRADVQTGAGPLAWSIELGTRRRPGVAAERVCDTDGVSVLQRSGRTMTRLDRVGGDEESIRQTLTSSWLSVIDERADAVRFPELAAMASWARGIDHYLFLDPWQLRRPSRRTDAGIGRPRSTPAR